MQTLKLGSRGSDVKTLQLHLNLYPDGIFGKITEETVRAFQRSKGLTPDGIVGPKTWQLVMAMPFATSTDHDGTADDLLLKKTNRRISRIIIHCTATPEGKDFTVADIRRMHKAQGWSDIGYHYVIYRDGSIYEGRDINVVGAHCQGYNTGSIGVVYVGGLTATVPGDSSSGSPKDTRTPEQRAALRRLVAQLRRMYPTATVHGHREFANKACPCFDVGREL